MSVRSPTAGTWSSSQWRPDNEFETYTAVASDQVVAFSLTGATLTLTLTVARPGAATVTVTAQDLGGLTATQPFLVALLHESPARVGRRGPHFSGPTAGVTLQG